MQQSGTRKARPIRQHRLDKGLKGWIVNYARQNYWRVASYYELEDLIQDGYVCYCKCNERYGHVRDQAHFMALVKTTFFRHIIDLSNNRTESIEITLVEPEALATLAPSTPSEGEFACLLRQLPSELAELLRALMDDAKSIPYLRETDARTPDGRFRKCERESRNEWLCRLIGADPKTINMEELFHAYFMPA